MHLYLVQHAEAKSKQEDPKRPLSEKGQADIGKVAAYLAARKAVSVDTIVHSGKTRAQQTASILAKALPPSNSVTESSDLAPMADPSIWTGKLSSMESGLMLVGHLPHLSKLAALLICRDEENQVVNFQMGGVVCLSRDQAGGWSVQWMITPDIVA
jgi:phosphohistidine phosphatase